MIKKNLKIRSISDALTLALSSSSLSLSLRAEGRRTGRGDNIDRGATDNKYLATNSRDPKGSARVTARFSRFQADFPIAIHPGAILREMLDERGVHQAQLARHLKTDVPRINEICRGKRGISAAMAIMLGNAFGTSPQLWMNLQKNWELSQVDSNVAQRVRPLLKTA